MFFFPTERFLESEKTKISSVMGSMWIDGLDDDNNNALFYADEGLVHRNSKSMAIKHTAQEPLDPKWQCTRESRAIL